jgi:hypothetical protein
MTWHTLPHEPRKLQATEARLDAIYQAARKGLKGDTLALAAGMQPAEYRQLCQFDPLTEMAELKGRADGEMEISGLLHDAARGGDAKAALAILQHTHGWTAKQEITIDVFQKISIIQALADANTRVIEGTSINDETPNRGNDVGLLTNNHSGDGNGYQFDNTRPSEKSTAL